MDSLFDTSAFNNTNEEENFDLPALTMTSSKPLYRSVMVEEPINTESTHAHLDMASQKELASRQMNTYYGGVQKLSDIFFETENAEQVFGQVAAMLNTEANSIEIHPRKYNIKAAFVTEEDRVQVKLTMSRVSGNQYCIEIMRKSGASIEFYQLISGLRLKIQSFAC